MSFVCGCRDTNTKVLCVLVVSPVVSFIWCPGMRISLHCLVNRCSIQPRSAVVDGTHTCCYALQQSWIPCRSGESSNTEAVSPR